MFVYRARWAKRVFRGEKHFRVGVNTTPIFIDAVFDQLYKPDFVGAWRAA